MKYFIISINDRSINNILKNRAILKEYQEINDVKYFDGTKNDAIKYLEKMGISFKKWNPWDKRHHHNILNTEAAVWINFINIFEYMLKNNIEEVLVFEDDIIINEDFLSIFEDVKKDLPKDYDFLSLYSSIVQNNVSEETEIGSKKIHLSNNQYSGFLATLFSKTCAKKVLKYLKSQGIFYTADCQIFEMSRRKNLNGYSLKDNNLVFEDDTIESIVDKENQRNNS